MPQSSPSLRFYHLSHFPIYERHLDFNFCTQFNQLFCLIGHQFFSCFKKPKQKDNKNHHVTENSIIFLHFPTTQTQSYLIESLSFSFWAKNITKCVYKLEIINFPLLVPNQQKPSRNSKPHCSHPFFHYPNTGSPN